MTNKVKGEVSFTVEGKEYTLNFSHGALIKLEDKLDKGIVKIIRDVQQWQEDPETIRLGTAMAIFWAGLQKHHPTITFDETSDLMTKAGGLGGTMEMLMKGLNSAFGLPEEGIKQTANPSTEAAPKMNGIGTASSSNTSPSDTISKVSGESLHVSSD